MPAYFWRGAPGLPESEALVAAELGSLLYLGTSPGSEVRWLCILDLQSQRFVAAYRTH